METNPDSGSKTKRWILVAFVSVLAAQTLLILGVQIDSRITRARAERLQVEMRSLIVGHTTISDLRNLSARWDNLGHYEDGCSAAKCEYVIVLGHAVDKPWLTRFLIDAGHSHFGRATLSVQLEDGVVTQATYWLSTYVPSGYGPRWEAERVNATGIIPYSTSADGYVLVARVIQKSYLSQMCCRATNHPNYLLSHPSGCEDCLGFWIEFTPQASRGDRYRMTDFNFACMTRWTPCKDEEDIMPDAGKVYQGELAEESREEGGTASQG